MLPFIIPLWYCSVCHAHRKNADLKFFRFPNGSDKTWRNKWLTKLGLHAVGLSKKIERRIICSRHFEPSCYTNGGLVPGSIPTLLLDTLSHDEQPVTIGFDSDDDDLPPELDPPEVIGQNPDLMDINEADDLDMPILTPPADHQKKFVFEGFDLPSDIINNAHSDDNAEKPVSNFDDILPPDNIQCNRDQIIVDTPEPTKGPKEISPGTDETSCDVIDGFEINSFETLEALISFKNSSLNLSPSYTFSNNQEKAENSSVLKDGSTLLQTITAVTDETTSESPVAVIHHEEQEHNREETSNTVLQADCQSTATKPLPRSLRTNPTEPAPFFTGAFSDAESTDTATPELAVVTLQPASLLRAPAELDLVATATKLTQQVLTEASEARQALGEEEKGSPHQSSPLVAIVKLKPIEEMDASPATETLPTRSITPRKGNSKFNNNSVPSPANLNRASPITSTGSASAVAVVQVATNMASQKAHDDEPSVLRAPVTQQLRTYSNRKMRERTNRTSTPVSGTLQPMDKNDLMKDMVDPIEKMTSTYPREDPWNPSGTMQVVNAPLQPSMLVNHMEAILSSSGAMTVTTMPPRLTLSPSTAKTINQEQIEDTEVRLTNPVEPQGFFNRVIVHEKMPKINPIPTIVAAGRCSLTLKTMDVVIPDEEQAPIGEIISNTLQQAREQAKLLSTPTKSMTTSLRSFHLNPPKPSETHPGPLSTGAFSRAKTMAVVTEDETTIARRTASSSRASAVNLSESYVSPLTIQQALTAASAIRQVVDNEENGTTLQSPSPAIKNQEEQIKAVELGEKNLLQSGQHNNNKSRSAAPPALYYRRVPRERLVHPPSIGTPIPASSDDSGFVDTTPSPNSESGNIPCRSSQQLNSSSPNPDGYVRTSIASEKSSSLFHSTAPQQDRAPNSPPPSDPPLHLSPFSRSSSRSQEASPSPSKGFIGSVYQPGLIPFDALSASSAAPFETSGGVGRLINTSFHSSKYKSRGGSQSTSLPKFGTAFGKNKGYRFDPIRIPSLPSSTPSVTTNSGRTPSNNNHDTLLDELREFESVFAQVTSEKSNSSPLGWKPREFDYLAAPANNDLSSYHHDHLAPAEELPTPLLAGAFSVAESIDAVASDQVEISEPLASSSRASTESLLEPTAQPFMQQVNTESSPALQALEAEEKETTSMSTSPTKEQREEMQVCSANPVEPHLFPNQVAVQLLRPAGIGVAAKAVKLSPPSSTSTSTKTMLAPLRNAKSGSTKSGSTTITSSANVNKAFSTTSAPTGASAAATTVEAPQKALDNEHTVLRVQAIMEEYKEQLRNYSDRENNPAVRKRTNQLSSHSSAPKRRKCSQSNEKCLSVHGTTRLYGLDFAVGADGTTKPQSGPMNVIPHPMDQQDLHAVVTEPVEKVTSTYPQEGTRNPPSTVQVVNTPLQLSMTVNQMLTWPSSGAMTAATMTTGTLPGLSATHPMPMPMPMPIQKLLVTPAERPIFVPVNTSVLGRGISEVLPSTQYTLVRHIGLSTDQSSFSGLRPSGNTQALLALTATPQTLSTPTVVVVSSEPISVKLWTKESSPFATIEVTEQPGPAKDQSDALSKVVSDVVMTTEATLSARFVPTMTQDNLPIPTVRAGLDMVNTLLGSTTSTSPTTLASKSGSRPDSAAAENSNDGDAALDYSMAALMTSASEMSAVAAPPETGHGVLEFLPSVDAMIPTIFPSPSSSDFPLGSKKSASSPETFLNSSANNYSNGPEPSPDRIVDMASGQSQNTNSKLLQLCRGEPRVVLLRNNYDSMEYSPISNGETSRNIGRESNRLATLRNQPTKQPNTATSIVAAAASSQPAPLPSGSGSSAPLASQGNVVMPTDQSSTPLSLGPPANSLISCGNDYCALGCVCESLLSQRKPTRQSNVSIKNPVDSSVGKNIDDHTRELSILTKQQVLRAALNTLSEIDDIRERNNAFARLSNKLRDEFEDSLYTMENSQLMTRSTLLGMDGMPMSETILEELAESCNKNNPKDFVCKLLSKMFLAPHLAHGPVLQLSQMEEIISATMNRFQTFKCFSKEQTQKKGRPRTLTKENVKEFIKEALENYRN